MSTATPNGYPVVKREADAFAVYDADAREVIAYAPGVPWTLAKSKALRERGTGHKCYYIGFPLARGIEECEHDYKRRTKNPPNQHRESLWN
jgi:hypothetical protein